MGLIPGYGSIIIDDGHGHAFPFLRAANTDVNIALALALVSFVFVEFVGIKYNGFFKYGRRFVNVGRLGQGLKKLFTGKIGPGFSSFGMGLLDAFIGLVEGIAEFIRIVSFTFRLFGNMTAGEILILIFFFIFPFVIPLVFYGLEMLVGFIQALIFGGLTLVFAATATTAEEH